MRRIHIVLAGILFVVLLGVTILIFTKDNDEGPEISFTEQNITYTEGSDTLALLNGVVAIDTVDGDVSDSLLVESIIPLRDDTTAKITYAAKDMGNHITKKSMIVNYIPAVIVPATEEIVAEEEQPVITPKIEDATVQVVEVSLKPTEIVQEPEEIMQEPAELVPEVPEDKPPVIILTSKEITLEKGTAFDPFEYIASVTDDHDTKELIYTRILIEGIHNVNKVGTYILEYYVTDSQFHRSESAFLKVYVTQEH